MTKQQEFRKQTEEAKFEAFSLMCKKVAELEKENAELKNRNQELLESCEGATMMYKDLQKANEIIKKLYAVYYDPCVTESDLKYRDELFSEIKQFIKDNEVEK